MRVPDSHLPHGLAQASSTSSKTEAILPIIQKMESADSSERKWACVAVSNLIQNDPSTRRLLQGKNVVGALIARLTDSEEEVVIEAMGSLRNLCIDGGYDICAEMYNKNILVPLKTFIPKISSTLEQFLQTPKSAPENALKVVYEFADNVITALWCLSETSNKALNAINAIRLAPFLMSFLASREQLPIAPIVAAAQCLYVLTDDNDPAINDVRADAGYISCLFDIVRSVHHDMKVNGKAKERDQRSITISVLAAGILRNISPLPPPVAASFVDIDKDIVLPLLQPVITSVSLPDTSNNVQALVSQQASIPQTEKSSLKSTPKFDHKSPIEIELERLESCLRTVQLALEILTGTCATLPDPGLNVDEAESDDNEENDDKEEAEVMEDMDIDMSTINDKSGMEQSETVPLLPPLVPALLALAQPTSLSFPPLASISVHPPTTSALSGIHVSALECLNNIFLSLARVRNTSISSDKEAGQRVWKDVWSALSVVGPEFGMGQERRREMWEISVGVLWGIGNVWKGSLAPDVNEVNLLTQFCNASSDSQTRVKCIGTLECLAQHPDSIDSNRIISEYLLSFLPTGTSSEVGIEPVLQSVSAIIDIYSDEMLPYDVNFRQGRYLNRLASSIDGMKKLVKTIDRRKPGGRVLRLRGEEIRDNLIAFVEYRKNLKL
ncbi:ARM repeat-containing protein [Guyanagaster necrorhizus]|uniref:ARM repeat-containing protein n=1 Tax=Guyanagaster necrorhizus TaxID=856835 RepID=A0A9P7W3Z8_9AGAR|nr:ARM repeat-containing protein [Guyanagaster necrorhizus MCA 3950]KAG7452218.1 ARM repeat-containing protein [Guyanagaster necrorhizus MCA 3950]